MRIRTIGLVLFLAYNIFVGVASCALVPDYYSEPGINSQREYVHQNFSEYIDPHTGKLQLHYVDMHIPGNGGLDIKVQRSYTSLDEITPDDLLEYQAQSIIGFGWDMHFGRIKRTAQGCANNDPSTSSDNPVIELPDGSSEVLFSPVSGTWSGGAEYISKSNWRADCSTNTSGQDVWTVVSPEGIKYVMSKFVSAFGQPYYWYTRSITDTTGNNIINFSYLGDDDLYSSYNVKPFISKISFGSSSVVTFAYHDQSDVLKMRLKSVTANGNIVAYSYDQVSNLNLYRLNNVNLPGPDNETGHWEYDYIINESNLSDSTPGRFSIKEIVYPEGGRIKYTYNHINFDASDGIATTVVKTKNTSGPEVTGGLWTYNYAIATYATGDLDITTVTDPINQTYTYKHYGINSAQPNEAWRIGLLKEKEISGGGVSQKEVYDWSTRTVSNETYNGPRELNDNNVFAAILDKKTVTRDNTNYITDYQNFTVYGNPKAIVESGNGGASKTTNLTYYNNTTKWIIDRTEDETVINAATVSGSTINAVIERLFYTSGYRIGKLQTETKFGVTTTYDYDSNGNLYTVRDANGNTTTYTNYYRGTAKNISYPDASIEKGINSTGTVQYVINGRGYRTDYHYDDLNRLSFINFPATKTDASITWTSPRQRVVTRGAYSQTTNYDGYGNIISIIKRDNNDQSITITVSGKYDALNRLVFETYPNSALGSRITYDALGRMRSLYHAATAINTGTASVNYEYLSGNKTKVTDENLRVTTYTYRSYGDPDSKSLIKTEAPEGIVVDIARNRMDLVDNIKIDAKERAYSYNSKLFLTSITNPEIGITTYTRDAVGNPKTRSVGTSGDTCYIYDSRNRLQKVYFPPSNCNALPTTPDIQYYYDKNGNTEKVVNYSDDITKEYEYDETDTLKLASVTLGAQTLSVEYGINGLDQVQSILYPSGRSITYNPDAFGRAKQALPYISSVTYHPNNLPKDITYANQTVTSSTLTERQWVDTLKTTGVGYVTLLGVDYDYDDAGNLDYISDLWNSSYDIDPEYDGVNRLKSIVGPWGGTHTTNQIVYDTRGNIKSKTVGSVSLTYNYNATTDRLNGISGSITKSFQYDPYGNISSDGVRSYNFNDNSALTSVTGPGVDVSYTYDGEKRLVKSQEDGRTTLFLYDGSENLLGEYDSNLNYQKEYVYLGGKLVATIGNVPATPTSLAVTTPDSNGNHSVSWGAASGNVTHYELIQSADPHSSEAGTLVYSGSNLNYALSASNGTYYYFVRACNGSECGDYQSNSSDCAVVGITSAPCMPASLLVPSSSGTGIYNLNWTASEGTVTSYQVQESLQSNFTNINQSYSSSNSPLLISGKADGTYYYRIRACNGGNCSSYVTGTNSISVLIVPNAPASLLIPSQVVGSGYTVSWGGVTGTVTSYKLYESTNASFSGESLVYQGGALSFDITGKTTDATYYYRVIACNQDACSSPRVGDNQAIVRHAPGAPSGLIVPPSNNTGDYTVIWQSATGTVTRYELVEANNSTFTNSKVVYNGLDITADITTKFDGSYYYQVRACNDFACSNYLNAANTVQVTNSPYTAALIVIVTGLLLN